MRFPCSLHELSKRLPWYYLEISTRFPWDFLEITMRLPWDCYEITMRFPWEFHEISMKFPWDFHEISLRGRFFWKNLNLWLSYWVREFVATREAIASKNMIEEGLMEPCGMKRTSWCSRVLPVLKYNDIEQSIKTKKRMAHPTESSNQLLRHIKPTSRFCAS